MSRTQDGSRVAVVPLVIGQEEDFLIRLEIEIRSIDGWDIVQGTEPEPEEPDADADRHVFEQALRDAQDYAMRKKKPLVLWLHRWQQADLI